jgi:hypothetical protein
MDEKGVSVNAGILRGSGRGGCIIIAGYLIAFVSTCSQRGAIRFKRAIVTEFSDPIGIRVDLACV